MIAAREYAPADSMYPLSGLDYLAPSTMLDPHASPMLKNMVATKGIATKRLGYNALGTVTGTDPVMAIVEFEVLIDVRILVKITTKGFYTYDPDTLAWTDRTKLVMGTPSYMTGDQTNNIDWVVARGTEGKWLIVTNGKDTPQYWDGEADTFLDFPCDLTDFVTCKTIAQFYDHLFLGNVQTSNTDTQLVAWSSVGTLTSFIDYTMGDSGSADVTGATGDIIKLKTMGDRLIVYSENSISSISYLGGTFVFSFEQVVSQMRLTSPQAIVDFGPYHIFLGQENWYIYDGERALYSAGDKVWRQYRNELFVEQKNRAFGFFDQAHQYVYWGVPVGDGLMVIYQQEYDLGNPLNVRWTKQYYTDQPLAMGFFSRDSSLKWNSPICLVTKWKDANWAWNQGDTREGFPDIVIGSFGGEVFIADGTSGNDNGAALEAFWDTPDFTPKGSYESQIARWLEIECELMGDECDVLYSVDQGNTYVLAASLELGQTFTIYRLPIDAHSRNVRIRFYNNKPSSSFSLRWARAWYKPGAAR